MMQGTTSRSAEEISQELEPRGMNLSVSSGDDYLLASGTAVKDDTSALFLVMQDVLTSPAFSQDEIDKVKKNLRQVFTAKRDNPSDMALENLYLKLYPFHPYGNVGQRIIPHLDLIKRQDIVDYFNTYVVPKNMVVSVVGGFDPAVIKSYFESAFPASLNNRSQLTVNPYTTAEAVPPLKRDETYVENKTTQAATWIAQGWLTPSINETKDHIPLKVINSLLGSGLSSRLFVDLREKHGLAYVVSSFYPSNEQKGQFVMYLGTDPKNQNAVLQGFHKEIMRLKSQPVSEKELQEAKDKLSGAFALAHETNANQAFYLGLYETLGVGYEYDNQYPQEIQQVTSQEVQQVAQKYFSQPSVTSIVAPPQAMQKGKSKHVKSKKEKSKKQ
jgi:predicted Zn-dependent peptidase